MKFTFCLGVWLRYILVVILLKTNFLLTDFFASKSFFTKKTNIDLRLMGPLDLWNDKRRPTIN